MIVRSSKRNYKRTQNLGNPKFDSELGNPNWVAKADFLLAFKNELKDNSDKPLQTVLENVKHGIGRTLVHCE